MTDQQRAYERDLQAFFALRQGLSDEVRSVTWRGFQLWRIANAIEALNAGIQEDIADEQAERRRMPWEKDDEDDE